MQRIPSILFSFCALALCVHSASGQAARPSQAAAEQAKLDWSSEIRAALGFEDNRFWRGGTIVSDPVKQGDHALRWEQHISNPTLECRPFPTDLSAFNLMTFWLHSSHANGATFRIIMPSGHDPDVYSYFSSAVTVDWTGWKQIELPFRAFGAARNPVGWRQIDSISFRASGWDQDPTNESVWVLDDLDFSYSDKPYTPPASFETYLDPPPREDFLANLRREHPRLIMLDEDLARIKRFIREDPLGQRWYETTRDYAEKLYDRPVETHRLPDGKRLLSTSRSVLDRMFNWGFMYRLERDPKWLERAYEEMAAVVAFPDWNPSHYLDTAEMMHAIALGYDWFYNDLSETQRKVIRDGLWEHGLRLSYATYQGIRAEGQQHWYRAGNNWNFVCNGGTALAAMALLDDMPEECSYLLHHTFRFIQMNLRHFEPDGAWWEGVGYWGYSMRYMLAYLRGLETAFDTDFGFVEALQDSGFAVAGDFPIYLSGPFGGIYNFANSGSGGGVYRHWGLFYLANRFANPLYEYYQARHTSGTVYDLIYYEPFESSLAVESVALDKHFRETEVATMRNSWTDTNALFAGIKSGKNGAFHSHQDLGSFIFYALGERWAVDLGTEGQIYRMHQHRLPKSVFYRIREEGHNTLVFNPDEEFSQGQRAASKIVRFESSAKETLAVVDLNDAYAGHAASVMRGYRLFDHRRALLVQDEIRSEQANELYWFSHAGMGIEIEVSESGRVATMSRNGTRCHVHLLSPSDAVFTVMDAAPLPSSPDPDIQQQNAGLRKLAVHLEDVEDTTIAVVFSPTFDFESPANPSLEITPVERWQIDADAGPLLSQILIDDGRLEGFTPEVFTYSYPVDEDGAALPAVVAKSADRNVDVKVAPPEEFPGTARITVRSGDTDRSTTYLVRFVPTSRAQAIPEKPHAVAEPETVDGITVTASRHDGNIPANVLDGNLETRWSANSEREWIAFDFGQPRPLSSVGIAWYSGDQRESRFKIEVSADGEEWHEVLTTQSSGKTADVETYPFPKTETARHLRITCYGNTVNLWNSMTAVTF